MPVLNFEFPRTAKMDYLHLIEFREQVSKIVELEAPKAVITWSLVNGKACAAISSSPEELSAAYQTLYMFYRVKPLNEGIWNI